GASRLPKWNEIGADRRRWPLGSGRPPRRPPGRRRLPVDRCPGGHHAVARHRAPFGRAGRPRSGDGGIDPRCPGAPPSSGSDRRAAVEERIARGAGRLALPVTAFLPDLETTLARFGEEIIKPYANA